MVEKQKDWIRLSAYDLDGIEMIDVRYWRTTKQGPRPTKKGIGIELKFVPQMISCFQKVWGQQNSEAARQPASRS